MPTLHTIEPFELDDTRWVDLAVERPGAATAALR
jgi:hypothetical protein